MPRSGKNKQAAEDAHRPASTDPCVAAVARPVRGDANPAEHAHEFAAKVQNASLGLTIPFLDVELELAHPGSNR